MRHATHLSVVLAGQRPFAFGAPGIRRTMFDYNYYSVPFRLVRQELWLKASATMVTLYQGIDFSVVDSWRASNGVRQEFGIEAGVPVIGSVSNFEPRKQ